MKYFIFMFALLLFQSKMTAIEEQENKEDKPTVMENKTFSYPKSESTDLTDEIKEYLDVLVEYLKTNPGTIVSITGHSDAFGTYEQNDKRSRERAEKVAYYLMKKGIPVGRIIFTGKGAIEPLASNKTEAGRRKNRRVEIEIIKQEKK